KQEEAARGAGAGGAGRPRPARGHPRGPGHAGRCALQGPGRVPNRAGCHHETGRNPAEGAGEESHPGGAERAGRDRGHLLR
ncbi:MAG TPA: hypothetical protein ENJ35_00630, partial [Gammaproteobacteria bacterium]|nr:hypothetical protein [Gammaproteobacteria bacterium]